MTSHGSAIEREETPQSTQTAHSNQATNQTTRTATIIEALKRRAHVVLNDRSLDPQSRAIIRYALETNDPWLAKMIERAEAGEPVIDESKATQAHEGNESLISEASGPQAAQADLEFSNETKVDILSDLICRPGDEPATKSAALLVLMATLENSAESKALAKQAKLFAFARCGDLNLHGIVDTQAAMLETELFAGAAP